MVIDFDSNKIQSRQEWQEHVLDLHFDQNKNYRQIAKEMKMSVRDIGENVNRANKKKSGKNTNQ
jgi:DNA-binding transcriptional regulator LsrR (DeoR family)